MSRRMFIVATTAYVALCAIVAFSWMHWPSSETFSSDAADYGSAAIHLAHQGFYSVDGVHPFIAREPGYSLFLAPLFLLFGDENAAAVFGAQVLLFFLAAFLFCHELGRYVGSRESSEGPEGGQRIAGICFFLLLTHISVFHSLFSAYREAWALILLLLFAALMLSCERRPAIGKAVLACIVLSAAILTYLSFLFLPIFLIPLWWVRRWNWKQALMVLILPFVLVAPWFVRNARLPADVRALSSQRLAYVWYVRGEQAERVHWAEPLLCLWAEYVSRDWSHRSDACSFNGLKNRKWPQGKPLGNEAQIAAEGQAKIHAHFPSYLWFSVFEVLELHLPFVGGGWSRIYNVAAALSSLILYIGCVFGLRSFFRKNHLLFILLPLYNTLFFILTDATPRYLIPVIFCYAVAGAIGYSELLARVGPRRFRSAQTPAITV